VVGPGGDVASDLVEQAVPQQLVRDDSGTGEDQRDRQGEEHRELHPDRQTRPGPNPRAQRTGHGWPRKVNPTPRTVWISGGSPSLRRRCPTWTSTTLLSPALSYPHTARCSA